MKKNCLLCGTAFIPKRSDAIFCTGTCKAKYARLKKGKGLSGVQPIAQQEEQPPVRPEAIAPDPAPEKASSTVDMDLSESFENTIFDNPTNHGLSVQDLLGDGEENEESPALPDPGIQEKNQKPIEPNLPAKYIPKVIRIDNLAYKLAAQNLHDCQKQKRAYEQEFARIEKLIELEKLRNGNAHITRGFVVGAALPLLYNLLNQPAAPALLDDKYFQKKREQKKKPKENPGFGFWEILLISAIAGTIGAATKAATEQSREKEKAKHLAEYTRLLGEARARLDEYRQKEARLIVELGKHPAYYTKEEQVLNPAYLAMKAFYEKEKQKQAKEEGLNGTANQAKENSHLETDKIISLKKVAQLKKPVLNFEGIWLDFLGRPQTNFFCVVHGLSGSGKSHFVMQFGKYLAENFGNVLYVSGEEGFATTFKKKILALGADIDRYYGAEFKTGKEILADVPNQYHIIIIDSVNNMGIKPELMQAIRSKFKQSGIIAVCQSTKDGQIRGSYEIVHDSDIAVKVMDGTAVTTKNRFRVIHKEFDVFAVYRKKKRDDEDDLGFSNTID